MDKQYWESYYENSNSSNSLKTPSTFAEFCLNEIFSQINSNLFELGCGNGRDAIFFAHNAQNVFAIDQCVDSLKVNMQSLDRDLLKNLKPISGDFVTHDYGQYDNIDIFYSRFTMHAITLEHELSIIDTVYSNLKSKGIFAIEARTINDPLYGEGKHISDTTYMTDHKRRFLNPTKFLNHVLNKGFNLKYFLESDNLSVVGNDNPILMRVILEKP